MFGQERLAKNNLPQRYRPCQPRTAKCLRVSLLLCCWGDEDYDGMDKGGASSALLQVILSSAKGKKQKKWLPRKNSQQKHAKQAPLSVSSFLFFCGKNALNDAALRELCKMTGA